jgi:CheY-like chemotaxis protein
VKRGKSFQLTLDALGQIKKIKYVLTVDDDEVSSYLIQLTLEEIGLAEHIATVHNGRQALDFLQQRCLDSIEKSVALPYPA